MINQLDRIDIAVADLAAASADYTDLLGVGPLTLGPADTRFRLANVDVRLAPAADGREGLAGLAFGVDSLARAQRALENRGLGFASEEGPDGPALRLAVASSHSLPVTLEQRPARDTRREAGPGLAGAGAVIGVDHVVTRSTNPDRALAFWGAQLGLSLRFDRFFAQMNGRVSLFRCGDMKIEVASRADPAKAQEADEAWGISWRAGDIAALNARLAQGFSVSPVRTGLQPGSQVFTIRDRTHGVATIAIGHDGASPTPG